MVKKFFPALFGLFLVTGCKYHTEEELYGAECNTLNITYSTTVRNLLNGSGCLSCHSGPSPSGSIRLDNYADLMLRVNDGRLVGAISHAPGFTPMPQAGNKMSDCEINKIKAWISAGAPDN
jgi:cytochrome c5